MGSSDSKSAGLSNPPEPEHASIPRQTKNTPDKVNHDAIDVSNLDLGESQETPNSSNAMSTVDSAKALRLMREVERAGVDLADTEAVLKIANQKLGMTPDQTRRVVKFVKLLADRKALIEGGGLNFNVDPKPKTKSPARDAASAAVISTNPTQANSPSQTVGPQNAIEPQVTKKSQVPSENPAVAVDHIGSGKAAFPHQIA